jgi:hypothetical protein
MSKVETFKGVMKTFFQMTKEDFNEMDHKLIRIAVGVVGFVAMTLFWFYFLRNIAPFGF